jgi:hypothetical protein
MDLIIRLIELLIQELMKGTDPNKPPSQRSMPGTPNPARDSQPPVQAMAPRAQAAPRAQIAAQDPVYDDEGWRRALAVLGLIVLVIMGMVWFLYMRGWLASG